MLASCLYACGLEEAVLAIVRPSILNAYPCVQVDFVNFACDFCHFLSLKLLGPSKFSKKITFKKLL